MNNLRNRVQLIGHIGQAPEIKTLDNGNKLAKFSVATNESYKAKDGKKVDSVQWHNITAWGTTATLIEKYVTKGQEVAVEGKLQNRKYDDKNGVTHYVTDIVANEIQFLGKAKA
jgi:single-strand DNA-binding protein